MEKKEALRLKRLKRLNLLYEEMDAMSENGDFVGAMLLAEKVEKLEDLVLGKEVITFSCYGINEEGKRVPVEWPT